jgi:hypothetical protein
MLNAGSGRLLHEALAHMQEGVNFLLGTCFAPWGIPLRGLADCFTNDVVDVGRCFARSASGLR